MRQRKRGRGERGRCTDRDPSGRRRGSHDELALNVHWVGLGRRWRPDKDKSLTRTRRGASERRVDKAEKEVQHALVSSVEFPLVKAQPHVRRKTREHTSYAPPFALRRPFAAAVEVNAVVLLRLPSPPRPLIPPPPAVADDDDKLPAPEAPATTAMTALPSGASAPPVTSLLGRVRPPPCDESSPDGPVPADGVARPEPGIGLSEAGGGRETPPSERKGMNAEQGAWLTKVVEDRCVQQAVSYVELVD